jgi:predicted HTH domain antitoxin
MEAVGMSLQIPAEILSAVKLPPKEVEHEFRKELALALYQRGVLSLGKARLLAQMTRWEFEELLGQRKILRHYTDVDLEEDIQDGLGRQ